MDKVWGGGGGLSLCGQCANFPWYTGKLSCPVAQMSLVESEHLGVGSQKSTEVKGDLEEADLLQMVTV